MNARERFLAACRREPVDMTPIWFMRQAGRYLPEYRQLRKQHSILELAKTPALATEVALQPLRVLDVDAAILFADIVLPLQPMAIDVDLPDNTGPTIARPIRTPDDVDRLRPVNAGRDLDFVMETVRALREELREERALIGFSGAPFTLASYVIEGKPNRDLTETKRFMYQQPTAWHSLLSKLATVVADYMVAQVRAGVDAVQLFDSWAGNISPGDYLEYVAPHTRRIFEALEQEAVPTIHFVNPAAGLLEVARDQGADVIGIDWRINFAQARQRLGPDVAIQGNLDPMALATSMDAARAAADKILADAVGSPGHVFNLGHGILPETPLENTKALVDHVHARSRKLINEANP